MTAAQKARALDAVRAWDQELRWLSLNSVPVPGKEEEATAHWLRAGMCAGTLLQLLGGTVADAL